MLYKELNKIELCMHDFAKSIKKLQNEFGINAPNSVIRQFYLDHHDKSAFIELYGELDLHNIKWRLKNISIEDLLFINEEATYPDFVKEIAQNAKFYYELGDAVIDTRIDIIQYWKNHGTWKTPPILINGTILKNPTSKFHLVEGHTRLGNLKGIYTEKVFKLANFHKIYYGEY